MNKKIASENDLEFGKDVVPFGSGILNTTGLTYDNSSLYNHIVNNQNATQNAILFSSGNRIQLDRLNIYVAYFYSTYMPPKVGYLIFYNSTYSVNNNYYSPAMQVMRSIDETILRLKSNISQAKLVINAQNAPQAKLRISGYDVVAANGGVW